MRSLFLALVAAAAVIPSPAQACEEAMLPDPKVVADLQSHRISGDEQSLLSADVKAELANRGLNKLIVPVKVCVGFSGDVEVVEPMKSTGMADADEAIRTGVAKWKYKPYVVNDVATRACGVLMINQTLEPAKPARHDECGLAASHRQAEKSKLGLGHGAPIWMRLLQFAVAPFLLGFGAVTWLTRRSRAGRRTASPQ